MRYAYAHIEGIKGKNNIDGIVTFRQKRNGVLVTAMIYNLPVSESRCAKNIFAFHIHEGNKCNGNSEDPFANAKSHFDLKSCPHPSHSGDMPPLFGNDGRAYSSFLTNRFTVDEIIGKTVIIHSDTDDFTTQPSGNSGKKIACGEIKKSFFFII